tara:strand:- start:163 stop:2247 length:2085 start_codon:yes stop_codon:yes gene_type:complete
MSLDPLTEIARRVVDMCTMAMTRTFAETALMTQSGQINSMAAQDNELEAFESDLNDYLWQNLPDGRGWIDFYAFEEGLLRAMAGEQRQRAISVVAQKKEETWIPRQARESDEISRAGARALFSIVPKVAPETFVDWRGEISTVPKAEEHVVRAADATHAILHLVRPMDHATRDAALKSGNFEMSKDGRSVVRVARRSEMRSPAARQSPARRRGGGGRRSKRDVGERAAWRTLGRAAGPRAGHWKAKKGMFSRPVVVDILQPAVEPFVIRLFRAVNAGRGATWDASGVSFQARSNGAAAALDCEASSVQRAVNELGIAVFPPERGAPLHPLVPPALLLRELARFGFTRLGEASWSLAHFARGRPDQLRRITPISAFSAAATRHATTHSAVRYTPAHIIQPLNRTVAPSVVAAAATARSKNCVAASNAVRSGGKSHTWENVDNVVHVLERKLRASLYTIGGSSDVASLFRRFDTSLSGQLSFAEFRTGVRRARVSKTAVSDVQLEAIFRAADLDGDQRVSIEELNLFMEDAMAEKESRSSERPVSPLVNKMRRAAEEQARGSGALDLGNTFDGVTFGRVVLPPPPPPPPPPPRSNVAAETQASSPNMRIDRSGSILISPPATSRSLASASASAPAPAAVPVWKVDGSDVNVPSRDERAIEQCVFVFCHLISCLCMCYFLTCSSLFFSQDARCNRCS